MMRLQDEENITLNIINKGKRITINKLTFPAMYLRDNCPKVFHSTTFHREMPVWNLPNDLRIVEAKYTGNGIIRIIYSDGYSSDMPLDFLQKNSTNNFHTRSYEIISKLKPWKAKDMKPNGLPLYNFEEIMQNDNVLLNFINTLTSDGIAKLYNCKAIPGQLDKIIKRVGFIRETNYGKIFEVRIEKNALNQAYTAEELPLHTDLPFYSNPPGVQILHCIVQSENINGGGSSTLADGLAVANKMKQIKPRLYRRLVESKVVFADKANNGEFYMKWERPIINENNGIPCEVNYNNHVRGKELNLNVDEMEEMYEALRLFGELAHSNEFMYKTRLKPGEMIAFSNRRILHGRSEIVSSKNSSRWLQGAYVDLDEVYSKQRCLVGINNDGEEQGSTISKL